MNWFTVAGALLHIIKNVPELVDDVEDIYEKLTDKQAAPEAIDNSVRAAITTAKPA